MRVDLVHDQFVYAGGGLLCDHQRDIAPVLIQRAGRDFV
jgi:hypothetical protein